MNSSNKILRMILTMVLAALLLLGCGLVEQQAGTGAGQQDLVVVTREQKEDMASEAMMSEAEDGQEETSEQSSECFVETENAEETADPEVEIAGDGKFANGSPYTREEALKLYFRKKSNRDQHYEKHGIEMGFQSAEDYLQAAREVVANPNALHKIEKEDGDDVYFIEETNEFVVVSSDGYLRTYFIPSAGKKYYDRQ